jgi:hypothetical protein
MVHRTSTNSRGGSRPQIAAWFACLAAACGDSASEARLSAPRPAQIAAAAIDWNASTQERMGVSSPGPAVPAEAAVPAANASPSNGSGLRWTTPAGWTERPATAMRLVNFRVGDDERAECYLTLLGGDGGGLAANVNRWRTQMGQSPLSAREVAELPKKPLLGGEASFVDFRGSFSGMGGPALDDARLVGLLLIAPQGAAFLKMTGPASALENQLDSFLALAASLQP